MKYLAIIFILLLSISCASKKVMKNCAEYKHDADSLYVCEKF